MPSADGLERQAHDFAGRVTRLLNGTVTHGIRLTSVLVPEDQTCLVGYRLSRRDPYRIESMALTVSQAAPSCFLYVGHRLRLDPEGEHLTDARSTFSVYRDHDMQDLLLSYDYNRDLEVFPEAHLHVAGGPEAFRDLSSERNLDPDFRDQHVAVGGRRFRPCLEDLIEFLIIEDWVNAHDGWERVVEENRGWFHDLQLKAAVRRNPSMAAEQLRVDGWNVTPPP